MPSQSTLDSLPSPKFPSARYFQIHFEELHLQIQTTQNLVAQLQLQVQQLELKLAAKDYGVE